MLVLCEERGGSLAIAVCGSSLPGDGCTKTERVSATQFGKVDANTYIMDFNPQIVSAAQAFAVSLSTFDTKVLL